MRNCVSMCKANLENLNRITYGGKISIFIFISNYFLCNHPLATIFSFFIPLFLVQIESFVWSCEERREYHGCGGKYNLKKRDRESNIIFPMILRLLGRISSGEDDRNFGEENQDFKKLGWGRISSCREHPCHPYLHELIVWFFRELQLLGVLQELLVLPRNVLKNLFI